VTAAHEESITSARLADLRLRDGKTSGEQQNAADEHESG
jgi:hypothetical protein